MKKEKNNATNVANNMSKEQVKNALSKEFSFAAISAKEIDEKAKQEIISGVGKRQTLYKDLPETNRTAYRRKKRNQLIGYVKNILTYKSVGGAILDTQIQNFITFYVSTFVDSESYTLGSVTNKSENSKPQEIEQIKEALAIVRKRIGIE